MPSSSPGQEAVLALLSSLQPLIDDYDIVVIDQTYDLAEARGPMNDNPLRDVLEYAMEHKRKNDGSIRIFILRTEVPLPGDSLYTYRESSKHGSCVSFVGMGESSHLGLIPKDLADYISDEMYMALTAQRKARPPFLRRRGVFKYFPESNCYFMFHYSVRSDRSRQVTDQLTSYLDNQNVDLVIYDSASAAPWFDSIISTACETAGCTRIDNAHVTADFMPRKPNEDEWWLTLCKNAKTLFKDVKIATTCFIVPAYHGGASLFDLESTFGTSAGTILNATIILDSSVNPQPEEHLGNEVHRCAIQHKGELLLLDYLYRLPIPQLKILGWKVQAAEKLGEVEVSTFKSVDSDGTVPSGDVGWVALWSLYESCGCGPENLVPEQRKKAIKYLPQLSAIDDYDAHWLAEVCLKKLNETLKPLGSSSSTVLIVVPKEDSGARKIAEAMHDQCAVAILPIPRNLISGESTEVPAHIESTLKEYVDHGIVVFDESVITGDTLIGLGKFVTRITHRDPLAYGTIIDVRSPNSESSQHLSVFSLQQWHPLREIEIRQE